MIPLIILEKRPLQSNGPSGKGLVTFFRARICDLEARKVYCCDNGSFPAETDLDILNSVYEEEEVSLRKPEIMSDTSMNATFDIKVHTKAKEIQIVYRLFLVLCYLL